MGVVPVLSTCPVQEAVSVTDEFKKRVVDMLKDWKKETPPQLMEKRQQ